jgi:hypothetical protein
VTPLRPLSMLALILVCTPAFAHAQNCFRGRPLPSCRTFWITESGIAKRLNRMDDMLATFELGRMRNRGRTAIGGTLFLGLTDQASDGTDVLIGVKPRFRTWLAGGSTSLEVSPGAFFAAKGGRVGFTGHAAINVGDRVALTGQVVALRPSAPFLPNQTDVAWYVGGKLGSTPGVVGVIAAPVTFFAILLSGGFRD